MAENQCASRILQTGDTGPCVRYLQELLRERSSYSGAVDGVMGEGTRRALMLFQQQSGLEPTGKTEPVTWEVLLLSGVPATPPPRQRCRMLSLGAEGPDVAVLQEQLERLGFAPGPADGVFGTDTERAVLGWQQASGLPANGIVGRRAWAKLGVACQELDQPGPQQLTPVLKPGDQGRAVVLLQALLLAAGFDPGATDGVYGNLTTAAVGAMQRATGLSVTQHVGPGVWAALGLPMDSQQGETSPTPRLRYGSRGRRVQELQVLLLEMGFDPGGVDAIYGQQLQSAVLRLQTAVNVPLTGKMGPEEWQALGVAGTDREGARVPLDRPLSPNDRGPQVEMLQCWLRGIGYDPGPVDGLYGPLTEAAVMLLQRSEGLPVTGIVDETTWNTL